MMPIHRRAHRILHRQTAFLIRYRTAKANYQLQVINLFDALCNFNIEAVNNYLIEEFLSILEFFNVVMTCVKINGAIEMLICMKF